VDALSFTPGIDYSQHLPCLVIRTKTHENLAGGGKDDLLIAVVVIVGGRGGVDVSAREDFVAGPIGIFGNRDRGNEKTGD
jgi:hypothetical protein